MTTEPIPMQTTPAGTRRLNRFRIDLGEPFIIASREEDPDEGVFVHPYLWHSGETLFLNWSFDRDRHDGRLPDNPNGRMSHDGGRTWQRQTVMAPPGKKVSTGPDEITSYWHAIAVPGEPGRYRMVTWRSTDAGQSWGDMFWTDVLYPDTRGLDIYDPPEGSRFRDPAYKVGGFVPSAPPEYMAGLFDKAGTRKRGPRFHDVIEDAGGIFYALAYGASYVPGGDRIKEEAEFWTKRDWTRSPILLQISTDRGRTWTYGGVVAFDAEHAVTDGGNGIFTEPAACAYPDGELVCCLRTGSTRPLYRVRSPDRGAAWSTPSRLPVRGILPRLARLPTGVLVLATGRPHCTVHFSLDRGATWPLSERLFTADESRPDRYAASTCNNALMRIDARTLLYVHDAVRVDPSAPHDWLKKAGFGRIVGRLITVTPSYRAACISALAKLIAPCRTNDVNAEPRAARAAARDAADLVLDGKLDDRFWKGLPVYRLRDVETGHAPSCRTTFRVAWSAGALCVGVRCDDDDIAHMPVVPPEERGDPDVSMEQALRIMAGDGIELLIETPQHSYYQLFIDPHGAIVHLDRKNNAKNWTWTSRAAAAAHIEPTRWSVELVLPVDAVQSDTGGQLSGIVGTKPTAEFPWRFNLCRQRHRGGNKDLSAFAPTGFPGWHERATFAKLIAE